MLVILYAPELSDELTGVFEARDGFSEQLVKVINWVPVADKKKEGQELNREVVTAAIVMFAACTKLLAATARVAHRQLDLTADHDTIEKIASYSR